MSIKIPVSADFNSGDLNKQIAAVNSKIKAMGDAIAKANGTKFEPITLKTKEDLKYFVQQSEKLLKIQGELKNRMIRSGQGSANPLMANWSQMYLNEATRLKRQQEMLVFFGNTFDDIPKPNVPKPPKPPATVNPPGNRPNGGGGPQNPQNPWWQQGGRILQSGLNGFGPVGNVANSSISTGMASGFGAGLMGLLGGLVALGVGKAVSSVMENLDKAERNNIGYDTLKRTIGDVNVSFEGLKTLIQENANSLGVTFEEATRLTTQFAKLGNVAGDRYKELGGELSNSVGFSRSFGLDPAMGTSFFGTMRGMRQTSNDQDSRRMGLLIGETIAKSDAFAKADEVMESIAGYVTAQTRNSLTRANVSGYAGMFSALAGSGIPGLDPAGTAGLLSRVNSALMGGGAKGEASQFFTSMVANGMGLNPIQMAIMKEGGAFATNDAMFGAGSVASMYGVSGPGGNKTFLEATLEKIRSRYPDKGMQAMAAANHLGISMGQAMSLLMINPNQMGTLQNGLEASGVDISKLKSSGIASLAKVYGTDSDRRGLADSLLRRSGAEALTGQEADRLRNVMAHGTSEEQKKMLTELIATREQERTMGTDIRDSKAILDNIKTALADKLIPLTLEMRHGIMFIAGEGGKKSPNEIQAEVIKSEYKDKLDVLKEQYKRAQIQAVGGINEEEAQLPRDEQMPAMLARQKAAKEEMDRIQAEIDKTVQERDSKVNAVRLRGMYNDKPAAGWAPGVTPVERISDIKGETAQQRVAAFLEAISASEGANYDTLVGGTKIDDLSDHPNKVGVVTGDGPSTAAGRYQITGTTWRSVQKALGLTDFGPESQDRAAIELLRRRGALQDVINGDVDAALSKLGNEWQGLPTGTSRHQGKRSRAFFDEQYNNALERNKPKQLPQGDPGSAETNVNVNVGSLEVIHKNERGEQIGATQTLKPTVSVAKPFGTA